ncbi:hypothetical protein T439DRAFT_352321 [Meredithblackwellia eburnea MCA 4105]
MIIQNSKKKVENSLAVTPSEPPPSYMSCPSVDSGSHYDDEQIQPRSTEVTAPGEGVEEELSSRIFDEAEVVELHDSRDFHGDLPQPSQNPAFNLIRQHSSHGSNHSVSVHSSLPPDGARHILPSISSTSRVAARTYEQRARKSESRIWDEDVLEQMKKMTRRKNLFKWLLLLVISLVLGGLGGWSISTHSRCSGDASKRRRLSPFPTETAGLGVYYGAVRDSHRSQSTIIVGQASTESLVGIPTSFVSGASGVWTSSYVASAFLLPTPEQSQFSTLIIRDNDSLTPASAEATSAFFPSATSEATFISSTAIFSVAAAPITNKAPTPLAVLSTSFV